MVLKGAEKTASEKQNFRNNDGESASTNEKGMGKLNTMLSLAYPCHGRQM